MSEAHSNKELKQLTKERCYSHAVNAYHMLHFPKRLQAIAGTGTRQGSKDVGGI